MGGCEICLLGRQGQPARVARNVRQIVHAIRGRHSVKPEEVRNRIELLFGPVNRIELFARTAAAGWDQWGNEPPAGTAAQVEVSDLQDLGQGTNG